MNETILKQGDKIKGPIDLSLMNATLTILIIKKYIMGQLKDWFKVH